MAKVDKVVFLTWMFPKLSETFFIRKLVALLERGIEVEIVCTKDPRRELPRESVVLETRVHELVTRYGLLDRVTYTPVATCMETARRKLSAADVMHIHFADMTLPLVEQGLSRAPAPVFVSCYEPDLGNLLAAPAPLREQVFDAVAGFCVSAPGMVDALVAAGAERDSVFCVPDGLDLSRFQVASPSSGPARRIFAAGRMVEKKGFSYLLEAISRIVGQGVPVRLRLAGDGLLRASLEEQARRLGIQEHVAFLGYLVEDEVLEEIRASDMVCVPSCVAEDGDKEGIPTILLESIACGKPVVTTPNGWISDIAVHGENALVVPEKDSAALAGALARLAADPALRSAIGRGGRELVERDFDAERTMRDLVRLYEARLRVPLQGASRERKGGHP